MSEQYTQSYIYIEKEDSVEILRCFSYDTKIEIPERIQGKPVRSIGAYAFSAHQDEQELTEGLRTGKYKKMRGSLFSDQQAHPACGEKLESVVLPESVQKIGAYCFYNCRNLREFSFTSNISEWGRGAFTGCHHVRRLRYQELSGTCSCLKEVLSEFREELLVEYCGESYARLLFPEYYEEGVENTPARILMTRVHGSGLYYRNCFQDRKFQFDEYDRRFDQAWPLEKEEFLLELVINRLRYPWGLTEKNRERYEKWLAEELLQAGIYAVEKKDLEEVLWVLEFGQKYPEKLKGCLSEWLQRSNMVFAQAASYLVEARRKLSPRRSNFQDFEL